MLKRTLAVLFLAVTLSACSASQTSSPSPSPSLSAASDPVTVPAQQWKPGSNAAKTFERLERYRLEHPGPFQRLVAAYIASHGDVHHPLLAALENERMAMLAAAGVDAKDAPIYMKAFAGTGPYRRVITKPGYSYVSGSVFLPCNAAKLVPQFETAFAYLGGWGMGDSGTAVDAGFQRSNLYGNYAAFISAQGYHQVSANPRFACGHEVSFQFYAASDTDLRLWARGVTPDGTTGTAVADVIHKASYGWPADGGGSTSGVVLKRMTSIAQADPSKLPPGVNWDSDGSYFGHYPNDKSPRVRWSNLHVGQVDKNGKPVNLVPWGSQQTAAPAGAYAINYPNNVYVILFDCVGCANESDAIDLDVKRRK